MSHTYVLHTIFNDLLPYELVSMRFFLQPFFFGFLVWTLLTCARRSMLTLNALGLFWGHNMQMNVFASSWRLICLHSPEEDWNLFWQILHWNGRSPIKTWNISNSKRDCDQTYLYKFNILITDLPVWILICSFKLDFKTNPFPQI